VPAIEALASQANWLDGGGKPESLIGIHGTGKRTSCAAIGHALVEARTSRPSNIHRTSACAAGFRLQGGDSRSRKRPSPNSISVDLIILDEHHLRAHKDQAETGVLLRS